MNKWLVVRVWVVGKLLPGWGLLQPEAAEGLGSVRGNLRDLLDRSGHLSWRYRVRAPLEHAAAEVEYLAQPVSAPSPWGRLRIG